MKRLDNSSLRKALFDLATASGNGGIRSLAHISLMVQFVPEFVPRLRAIRIRLQLCEKTTRIEWSPVSAAKMQPSIVI